MTFGLDWAVFVGVLYHLVKSGMRVFPVLDLLGGDVVRGIAGQRQSYRPLVSSLECAPEPLAVAHAIREHFGLTTFYLADLDAILHETPHWDTYRALASAGYSLWIDAGIKSPQSAQRVLDSGAERVIVGLESIAGPHKLMEILAHIPAKQIVFSVDLQQGLPLHPGPGWAGMSPLEIAQAVLDLGVRQLIVLDLAQVGVNQGVSTLPLCAAIREWAPDVELTTGGGVRSATDLVQLLHAGIEGVLLASALHDGRITRGDLETLGTRISP